MTPCNQPSRARSCCPATRRQLQPLIRTPRAAFLSYAGRTRQPPQASRPAQLRLVGRWRATERFRTQKGTPLRQGRRRASTSACAVDRCAHDVTEFPPRLRTTERWADRLSTARYQRRPGPAPPSERLNYRQLRVRVDEIARLASRNGLGPTTAGFTSSGTMGRLIQSCRQAANKSVLPVLGYAASMCVLPCVACGMAAYSGRR
jgi:hypothetical protein